MNLKPRVLFDLSILRDERDHHGRGGVFRLVESMARHLVQRQDVETVFTGFQDRFVMKEISKRLKEDGYAEHHYLGGDTEPLVGQLLRVVIGVLWRLNLVSASRSIQKLRDRLSQGSTVSKLAGNFDVLHSPFYPIPKAIRERLQKRGVVLITSVYDLIPWRVEGYRGSSGEASRRLRRMIDQFTSDDWVICCSEFTRVDLLRESTRLDPNKVRVIPLAIDDAIKPGTLARSAVLKRLFGDNHNSATSYVLSVASIEPRKNVITAARAFVRALPSLPPETKMVLVGTVTPSGEREIRDILALECGNRIVHVGPVEEAWLSSIYTQADMLLFLSIYEGFGLPPLEAMRCRCPIITSSATSLPEVVGDAGLYVQGQDVGEVAEAIIRLKHDPIMAARLVEDGSCRSSEFTTQRMLDQLTSVYQQAAFGLS